MDSQRFRRDRLGQSGFGLLEVLVTLVIFASVGFTILAWFQQSVDTVQRLRSFYQAQDARKVVLEVARTLNPMTEPSGETPHGALRLVWVAQPEGEEILQIGYPRGVGRHRLRLYQTTFSVFKGTETKPWIEEKLTLIGHRLEAAPAGTTGNE